MVSKAKRRTAAHAAAVCGMLASIASAQSPETRADVDIFSANPGRSICTQHQIVDTFVKGVAECKHVGTYTAVANATVDRNAGGGVSSSLRLEGSGADITAGATIADYISLRGPVEQIYYAALRSTATVRSSANLGIGAALAEMFIGYVVDGGTLRGASETLQSRFDFESLSRAMYTPISGDLIRAGGNSFFFGLFVSASSNGHSGPVFANAQATLPTLAIYDEAGVDITNQFEVGYQSTAITATPEPATMALVATGLAGLAGVKRRRQKRESTINA